MTNSFNIAMGRTIRELRLKHGLCQEDVGAVLGVSAQQVSKAEAGTNSIAACDLPKLAKLFGVTVASLYKRASVPDTQREPTKAENDGFLIARYVSRIEDPKLRSLFIDLLRKLAYQKGAAA